MREYDLTSRWTASDDESAYDDQDWNGEYDNRFPNQWRDSHAEGTGPEDCENCRAYGTINNVFVGYCANCAQYVYHGERGRGFIDNGIEIEDEIDDIVGESVFETYLIENIVEEPDDPLENEDDEPFDNSDTSVFACHYEGGYNDF
jgi:hypothetical protein